ncbi:MAG TPA: Xaa-Pro peptidase family protein [Anaeromyxobacter sp.]|nr:Xaa-Pro peptidase family protein [Anaeromyxobacter sp.]
MDPSTEHGGRTARLQEALRAQGLDGALLLQAVDVYYLAATRQSGALFVPASGEPILLVRRSLSRARAESAVADVRPFPPSRELAQALGARGRLGATFDAVPAATLDWWRAQLRAAEWVDVSRPLRELRSRKSPRELGTLREAGALLAGVLAQVPALLREGMREVDLSAEIEYRLRRAGNLGSPRLRAFNAELFLGLALAGDGAAGPGCFDGPVTGGGLHPSYPQGSSERAIRRGEPVFLDWTAVHGGYVADMTRMAAIGDLEADLARAFEVALAIQAEVAAGLRPGATGAELWARARAMAEEAGLADRFMGPPGDQARFVGHGVGLELDELPLLAPGQSAELEAGQVVAVEPKFVFPGRGAVGIENTWVVTEGGGERITGALGDQILRAPAH